MQLKTPLVIDLAYNNLGSDLRSFKGRVDGVYCKATEGYFTKDPQFSSSWSQLKALGIPRAAYHFYRETWYGLPRDPIRQANEFVKYVNANGGFIPGDRAVLDAEDTRMTIGKVLACAREIRRLTGFWPWLYSGYYKLKEMAGYDKLTPGDILDLKEMGVIIAYYPDDPDKFTTLPSNLVPDPKYFGPVIGWQYAGDTYNRWFTGIKGNLDFNMFDQGAMFAWASGYVPSPQPEPEPTPVPEPAPDATFVLTDLTTRNDMGNLTTLHVLTVDLGKYDIVMDSGLNFMTTDRWLVKQKVDFAINGLTGWYIAGSKRRPVAVLDGSALFHGKGVAKFGELNLYIDPSNHFSIDRPRELWNAYGFPNVLIKDGQIQPTDHDFYDIRARTALGVNKDQSRLYIVVVDGGDYWEKVGMNFQQVAKIMLDLGCDLAVMGDGGGSTTMIRADILGQPVVVGKPSGEEKVVIGGTTYHMRPVAVHFGLKRK